MDTIAFVHHATGELITEQLLPAPGVRYVENGKPRGYRPAANTKNVTDVLMREPSPMS